MFRGRAKPGLSRKIVACYLFFCVTAVAWLSAGAVITSQAVVVSRAADFCLTRIGSASATLKLDLQRSAGQSAFVLNQLQSECRAKWCGLVGQEGKFLAHTNPAMVGRTAVDLNGERVQWGDVTRVEYTDADESLVHEYRCPLTCAGLPLAELRIAAPQPNLWSTMQAAAPLAPLAVLAPLGLVGLGAWLLQRVVKPLAEVDASLQRVARTAIDAPLELEHVRQRDATSFGWNRIVDYCRDVARRLAERREEAAGGTSEVAVQDGRFEEVLQRLTDGIAVTDAAGRIEFANQAIAALLGQDGNDPLNGSSLEERLTAQIDDESREELLSPASRRRTAVCEWVQQTAEAERVLRVARMPLGKESARRFVWSLRDVTQQRLAEQTRDRFIDTATHELRTPLTNIKAYAETLATSDYIDVELQKEFCNIINSEVTRLARFIDDLLSISSMEVGALTIDRQKVETERMFAEIIAKVEPQMQQKSIEFRAELSPKLPELHLDKDKIIAVAVNLLGNAAKYTPHGGSVTLRVKVEDGHLRIAVQDTGVGIAAEELPKVFEKFFRSDDPRVQAEVGSGLGLSLAREVVRMHGGDIIAESVLNQGSTFAVLLPLT